MDHFCVRPIRYCEGEACFDMCRSRYVVVQAGSIRVCYYAHRQSVPMLIPGSSLTYDFFRGHVLGHMLSCSRHFLLSRFSLDVNLGPLGLVVFSAMTFVDAHSSGRLSGRAVYLRAAGLAGSNRHALVIEDYSHAACVFFVSTSPTFLAACLWLWRSSSNPFRA